MLLSFYLEYSMDVYFIMLDKKMIKFAMKTEKSTLWPSFNWKETTGRILWVWRGRIGEYRLSPERLGAIPSWTLEAANWGSIWTDGRRPEVRIVPQFAADRGGWYCPQSRRTKTVFSQYVRARLIVFTLLFNELKPAKASQRFLCIQIFLGTALWAAMGT